MVRRLSTYGPGDIAKSEVDRIGCFVARELCEISLVGRNNDWRNGGVIWELILSM